MANHQISSTVHDRYHGAVKAQELRSHKIEHRLQAMQGKTEDISKLRLYDGFELVIDDSRSPRRDALDGREHRHDKLDSYSRSHNDGRRELIGRNAYGLHKGHFAHGKADFRHPELRDPFHGAMHDPEFGKITYQPSRAFSGSHLGSPAQIKDAHQNFLNAALDYIKNPSEQAYKALTESMTKLLDPKLTPAANGGAVKVELSHVNGSLVAKFTMEVTPAATKSLDEAREALKNAYSNKRNGESGIADLRAQAYTDYIRALSEKFKKEGKIDHTNHTPTTPVFKAPVFYLAKGTQVNLQHLHELKKPNFHNKHHVHGKLVMKNHQSVWNDYRHNHKSYVDLMKHDKKPHTVKGFDGKDKVENRHGHHRADDRHDSRRVDERKAEKAHDRRADERNDFRRSDLRDTDKAGRNHPHKARAHRA